MEDLKNEVKLTFANDIKQVEAGKSFLLSIVTLGIYGFIWWYKMNRVWDQLQKTEQEFDDHLSQIWNKLGLIKYPLSFKIDPSKNRSYIGYLCLIIVTFGIWGLVWDHKIHTDPENLYGEFHAIEDSVLQVARQTVS
ncbi:MAG: DUF4234 domain-containing protein [Dehalococcoidia bacterium]|nr:DUF4234 domain-containing protein [Dehalococcoidia bacterium]